MDELVKLFQSEKSFAVKIAIWKTNHYSFAHFVKMVFFTVLKTVDNSGRYN